MTLKNARQRLSQLFSARPTSRKSRRRQFRFEPLESRTVLSASSLTFEDVTLLVNDREVVLDDSETTIRVTAGDTISVHNVDFAIDDPNPSDESAVAAEAYFRKSGTFDYGDGRFGDTRDGDGTTEIALQGQWQVERGWARVSIPLLYYEGDTPTVHDRFFINLQVMQSVQDQLQCVANNLWDFDRLNGRWVEKLKHVSTQIAQALITLNDWGPDVYSVLGNLESSVDDLQTAVDSRSLSSVYGNYVMSRLTSVARQIAVCEIDDAVSRGTSAAALTNAHDALAAGDQQRSVPLYGDAVRSYITAYDEALGA